MPLSVAEPTLLPFARADELLLSMHSLRRAYQQASQPEDYDGVLEFLCLGNVASGNTFELSSTRSDSDPATLEPGVT